MRIDRSRIKKSTSEVPAECQVLIEKLRSCTRKELLEELKKIESWSFGKCELYHWIDILDLCDSILEDAAAHSTPTGWQLVCDLEQNTDLKELLLWVLNFTTLLIEHSFSRHLYNSVEHLHTLLSSSDHNVVLGVLNLLYMFSKRSNFITRINPDMRNALLKCLTYLAESWGGKENGFGLADCVKEKEDFPQTATTLHYEFYTEDQSSTSQVSCIHLDNVASYENNPAEIMDGLIEIFNVPKDGHMMLFTHLRLAHSFSNRELRLKCVQARLQALSVLLYSNADSSNLLYPGILDELVELLELNSPGLVDIRSAALRTLTSIIHLDRSPHVPKKQGSRLTMIIEVTGAGLYHGFLPTLVRSCISSLTNEGSAAAASTNASETTVATATTTTEQFPLPLATALFSFLYHLASYEAGGEALVSCGMMECLLRVINWPGLELEHITFVTRAVRVIDLITNIDMQSFQTHGGLTSFINRLEMEMSICRQDQPYEIVVANQRYQCRDTAVEGTLDGSSTSEGTPAPEGTLVSEGTSTSTLNAEEGEITEDMLGNAIDQVLSTRSDSSPSCSSKDQINENEKVVQTDGPGKSNKTCLPQRAALLKSMLNFLKKALQDPAFAESIRHVMDGSLPSSLKHIISNAEYYGPSLFLLATDVVAVYVFQEPSLLSSLQDVGLTDVVLHALLIKSVPATREVLGSVPNVCSAMCLNARGLASFIKYKPFERLFKVLLSPNYLSAMRRRRSSDPAGDTASNLGNAMDELMRHQPSLKADAISAIIKLLQELCQLGRDPKYVCWKPQKGSAEWPQPAPRVNNEAGSSDEEEEDEEEASTSSHPQREDTTTVDTTTAFSEKTPIALVDYILNVMKFVDAILSNNSTDDHCREFVNQNGLVPLLSILGLPNLPVDYTITPAAQAVASVCKSVLNLAHESKVMEQGLKQLSEVLARMEPLMSPHPTGSTLVEELSRAPNTETAFSTPSATPLLHAMAAVHGYVFMFVHVCRTGQMDIRTISMTYWSSELGLRVLKQLSDLYLSLVWESTILLALCSEFKEATPEFRDDVAKIYLSSIVKATGGEMMGNGNENAEDANTDVEDEKSSKGKGWRVPISVKLKYLKPLLGASSRLGRALAELFGLLVKLSVGFPVRTRRGNQLANMPVAPSPAALEVSKALSELLARGLNHKFLPPCPIVKFKLTYLICSIGFTQPMLFDEKSYPYQLMLHKFVLAKGQTAFFETFKWALTVDGKYDIEEAIDMDLPEGTAEFLEAFLILLERMVNPKAVLESPHWIPYRPAPRAQQYKQFRSIRYLQKLLKEAFETILHIWGKFKITRYGAGVMESIITIFRHIIRGEKIIEERKSKELEATNANPSSSGANETGSGSERRAPSGGENRPDVNSLELSQLMDMGFSRDHCYEALILTANLEHATDYLLNNFFPHTVQTTSTTEQDSDRLCLEEEDMIDPEKIKDFCSQIMRHSLYYIDSLPELVFKISELITNVIRRSGEEYATSILKTLAHEIKQNASEVGEIIQIFDDDAEEAHNAVMQSVACNRLSGYLHLFMLLFEEMKVPCARMVHETDLLPTLIPLMATVTGNMPEGAATPKWMAPLLLLIDLNEKVTTSITRKVQMHKVTTSVWRWLDLSSGKWALYLPNNNKLINEAYWRGDRSVTITSGRRGYSINFVQMLQINNDSGKARPVMMTLVDPKDKKSKNNYDHQPKKIAPIPSNIKMSQDGDVNEPPDSLSEPEYYVDFFHRRVGLQPIPGLSNQCIELLIKCCVYLMAKPVDPDTLHAVMNCLVRFTRDYKNAFLLSTTEAIKELLKLYQVSHFNGFVGLATMLIRHALEEPASITAAVERVIRCKTHPSIPPTYKDLHYILRECAPAICRNPEIFKTVAKDIMRVDIALLTKRGEEDDPRLLMKSSNDQLKTKARAEHWLVKDVIDELLNFIVVADHEEDNVARSETKQELFNLPQGNQGSQPVPPPTTDESTANSSSSRNEQDPDLDTFNASSLPMYIAATGPSSSSSAPKKQQASSSASQRQTTCQQDRKKRLPLLTISNVLKILADAVRSYTPIASIITEHKYSTKEYPFLKEDCSAIAFILDNVMPQKDHSVIMTWDQDRPNSARNLLAAIASCNHSSEAQSALVTEVKAALARTLAWPESSRKHSHIQDLVGVITTMIENCPPVPISSASLSQTIKLNQYSANNMVKLMMRKGIITDLARIPHSLDLSSPKMAATINAALKPLETLSRIMSQPTGTGAPAKPKPKPRDSASLATNVASSETNQGNQEQAGLAGEMDVVEDDNIDEHSEMPQEVMDVINRVEPNEIEALIQEEMRPRVVARMRPSRSNMLNHDSMRPRTRGTRRHFQRDLTRYSSVFSSSGELNLSNNEETSQDSSSEESEDSSPSGEDRRIDDQNTSDIDNQVDEDDDDDEEDDDDDEDDEDDDDDDDDDDDQEGENNDAEENNSGYNEDNLELFDQDDGLFRIPGLERDSDDFLMIEYSEPDTNAHVRQAWARDSFLPFTLFDDSNSVGNDTAGSRIPTHHPLQMSRQPIDPPSNSSGNRTQRMSRTRRYQYIHMNRATVPAPVFLQRLMSQNISDGPNYLNIPGHPSNTIEDVLNATFPNPRLIVMDNGLGILTNSEEEQINYVDQRGYLSGPSLTATLSNVPTSMQWWNEELRLLDGDSVCDCAIHLGSELVPYFERLRNEELSERREKKKREEEEDSTGKPSSSGEPAKKKPYGGSVPVDMSSSGSVPQPQPSETMFGTSETLSALRRFRQDPQLPENLTALSRRLRQEAQRDNTLDEDSLPSISRLSAESRRNMALEIQSTANWLQSQPPNVPRADAPAQDSWEGQGTTATESETPAQPQLDAPATDAHEEVVSMSTEREPQNSENERSLLSETPSLPSALSNNEGSDDFTLFATESMFNSSQESVYQTSDNSAVLHDPPNSGEISSQDDEVPPTPPQVVTTVHVEAEAGASSAADTSALGGILPETIPEGVDPSFLAALPEDMRAEVISEHLRQQRLQNRIQQSSQSSSGEEVNPDFLAALPPNIQEEVLAQQRAEQQRQQAAQSNPNDPVDAAAFFQDLPSSLRQAILTDMEESQISVLPPELAAEAQNLRREWEARNRQLFQERFISHVTHNNSTLSTILRQQSGRNLARRPGLRYVQNIVPSSRAHWLGSWNRLLDNSQPNGQSGSGANANLANASLIGRARGRQVLDYESICCLLVLLFVDDSRLNTPRLHRVFRNLCYHQQTREWIIRAILSIMDKSNESQVTTEESSVTPTTVRIRENLPAPTPRRIITRSQSQLTTEPFQPATAQPTTLDRQLASSATNPRTNLASWLNISMDAALGCRANVFHVQKNPNKRNDKVISINPQAAPFVYRHTLEILISLARIFPSFFVPGKQTAGGAGSGGSSSSITSASPPKAPKSPRADSNSSFWDLLNRLDSTSLSKKGKAVTRPNTANPPSDSENMSLENSPFGQLLKMMSSPVVHRSSLLMDKLLRLLSLISISLQVHRERLWDKVEVNEDTVHHLGLAINVLTSNTCSEEGLEDATALLLNMSVNLANTRQTVLSMLLVAARNMALTVCSHIEQLLQELRDLNTHHAAQHSEDSDDSNVDSKITSSKGILSNRFTKDTVVVTAPKKVKPGLDLQLNSMAPLISKTSSQAFLLRILKVIVQLRESVRNFDKKQKQTVNETGGQGVPSGNTAPAENTPAPDNSQPPAGFQEQDTPMDTSTVEVKPQSSAEEKTKASEEAPLPPLSDELDLDILWNTLSQCLTELQHTQDTHAVLVLQPAVEAFFLVHASGMEKPDTTTERERTERGGRRERSGSSGLALDGLAPAPPPVSPLPSDSSFELTQPSTSSYSLSFSQSSNSQETTANLPPHQMKFLKFAETHRTVLNQILRQCTTPLLEGPFAVLVNHTRLLDFDVKRRYFRSELERLDEGHRREELAVNVRRNQVFEDSFRELHRKTPDDWKNRFYIVFEGEEGQDAGGLLREWYVIISREIFNPMYALFTTSPGDRVTYMINSSSHCNPNHLFYFKFVGRVIAKAIYDNKLLECYFTRSFYKHILGILVKYTDMESEDYSFYQGLVYLMENHVESLGYDLTFSTEVQEFGVTDVRDLIPKGRNILVTEENKMDYIRLVCQMKMTGAIRKQLNAFLEGFYEIIPMRLISIFNEQELELLISGLPNVDIEDLKANTEYHKYQHNSLQIQWFWRALREFDQAERAKFLQFVTGTSKVPLQGFGALEGMNGVQKFQIHRDERSTDRLPSAHTCFNQLDLPVYETYTKLRTNLLKAIHECSEGFGFA